MLHEIVMSGVCLLFLFSGCGGGGASETWSHPGLQGESYPMGDGSGMILFQDPTMLTYQSLDGASLSYVIQSVEMDGLGTTWYYLVDESGQLQTLYGNSYGYYWTQEASPWM